MRVAIQQRVTGNLLVTFATDITSTQRQACRLNTSSIQMVGQWDAEPERRVRRGWKVSEGFLGQPADAKSIRVVPALLGERVAAALLANIQVARQSMQEV